jgi:hypothetical protein
MQSGSCAAVLGLEHVDRRETRLPGDAILKINCKTDIAGPKRIPSAANSYISGTNPATCACCVGVSPLSPSRRSDDPARTSRLQTREARIARLNATYPKTLRARELAQDACCWPSTRSAGSISAEASSSSDRRCRTPLPTTSSPSFKRTAPPRPSTGCNGKDRAGGLRAPCYLQ